MKSLWQSILLLGHPKLRDQADLRQLKILNGIAALGALNLSFFIPVAIYMGLPEVVAYVSFGVLCSLICLLLNAKGHFRISRVYFLIITLLFGFCILVFMSGRDGGTQIVFIMFGSLHLVLFRSAKHALLLFLVSVLLLAAGSYWVETHRVYLDHLSLMEKKISFYLNIASCMLLVYAMILYFNNTAAEFEATIVNQNKAISQKNKDMMDSITYARRLQEAILPPDSFIKRHLPDCFVFYKPKDIVAGDFYWMQVIQSEGSEQVLFAVADCTGHGVPGAMVSVVCSNALNRTVKEFGITQPAKILDKVRELVIETFAMSESEVKDGMDISLVKLDAGRKLLEWAGANNPLWLLRAGNFQEIKADKQPIGKDIRRKAFTHHSIALNRGDCIYLFTDGFADQFGGPKGKKYKYRCLASFLTTHAAKPMEEQLRLLKSELAQWQGSLEQIDDVCVAGIRV